eukprot:PhM_4_TR17745/c0_g1_i1/m.3650
MSSPASAKKIAKASTPTKKVATPEKKVEGTATPNKATTPSKATTPNKAATPNKATTPKQQKKDVVAAPAAADAVETIEPDYNTDVHIKRQAFIVKVSLHKVPEKLIDVEVENEHVIVSTMRHTKKYRVVIPMPEDVKPNINKCTSDITPNGVLTIIVPLLELGNTYVAKHQEIQSSIRQARNLRFGETLEGDVKMRTKTLKMKRPRDDQVQLAKDLPAAENAGTWEIFDAGAKVGGQVPSAEAEGAKRVKKEKQAPSASAKKKYVTDKSETILLMQQATEGVQRQIEEKQKKMEELQRARSMMMHVRRERKAQKEDKTSAAYRRMLDEKKDHLDRMMEASGVTPQVVKKVHAKDSDVTPEPKRLSTGKKVSFASNVKPK